jgi:hypothetical protein
MSAYVLSTAAQARKSRHQLQLGSKQITKEQIVNALMPQTVEIITRVHPKGGHNVSYRFDHVIGSAAVVERLWSVARYILTTNRSSLSPVLFEALLFLRSNRTLWDVRTVQRALLAVREDQKSDRLKKKLAEVAEADGEDEDGEDTDIEDEGE